MGNSQGVNMAQGQKINDHSSWIGAGKDGVVYPAGAKMKNVASEEGAGAVMKYEDNVEAINAAQKAGANKIKSHPMKQPGYRN